ncbi:MAG TPA: hypothetical protein VFJ65_02765 [Solirubrobacterales bacterium]|nr:hypothetical protein [Solirubrobacterales bacterium]
MEDWRYENLKADMKLLREEVREVRGRTYKVENWQSMLPLRVMEKVMWLIAAGTVIFVIAEVLARSR